MKERRQYRRWRVSMPCSVKWEDGLTKGLIANISFGGALVSETNALSMLSYGRMEVNYLI